MLQSMKMRSGFDCLTAIEGRIDGDTELPQHFDDHLAVDGVVIGHQYTPVEEYGGRGLAPCTAIKELPSPQPVLLQAFQCFADIAMAQWQHQQIVGLAACDCRLAARVAEARKADDLWPVSCRDLQTVEPA
jgi:hypothetical protein